MLVKFFTSGAESRKTWGDCKAVFEKIEHFLPGMRRCLILQGTAHWPLLAGGPAAQPEHCDTPGLYLTIPGLIRLGGSGGPGIFSPRGKRDSLPKAAQRRAAGPLCGLLHGLSRSDWTLPLPNAHRLPPEVAAQGAQRFQALHPQVNLSYPSALRAHRPSPFDGRKQKVRWDSMNPTGPRFAKLLISYEAAAWRSDFQSKTRRSP
jgi:hypothetical protein